MAVKIRLQRKGRKKRPFYHIVVADARSKRDGKYIERIGSYNPLTIPATIELNRDSAYSWIMKGAQPTNTVRAILQYNGVFYRKHLMRGVAKGAMSEEQAMEKYHAWIAEKEQAIQKEVEKTAAKKAETLARIDGKAPPKKVAKVEEEAPKVQEEQKTLAESVEQTVIEAPEAKEEAPVVEETPAPEAKEEAPVVEETPAPEAKEEAPVVEETPAPEAKEEAPVVEETPAPEAEKEDKKEEKVAEKPAQEEATIDDYLSCKDYAGETGFHKFLHEAKGEHYFGYNGKDGVTYLRSEGYTTESARDNGIASVTKNFADESKWVKGDVLNGKHHYYALRAGNNQEIARSCYYKSAEEMEAAFQQLINEEKIEA